MVDHCKSSTLKGLQGLQEKGLQSSATAILLIENYQCMKVR